jgi:hypothetical protein
MRNEGRVRGSANGSGAGRYPRVGQCRGELAGDVEALAMGNNAFALDLHSAVSSRDGNICISPYSISSALAMTYADALHFMGRLAEPLAKQEQCVGGRARGGNPWTEADD